MAQFSGQFGVSSSTVTQFPDFNAVVVYLVAHPDNTQDIFVGNNGSDSISILTGFPITPSGSPLRVRVDGNLNQLYALAEVDNEKICWLISED